VRVVRDAIAFAELSRSNEAAPLGSDALIGRVTAPGRLKPFKMMLVARNNSIKRKRPPIES